jgi:putative FmdB family regulatory protein
MPTYTYTCSNCGVFEEQQSIKEDTLKTCPKCGMPVKRVITGGSGFIMRSGASPSNRNRECNMETPCCGREVRCNKPPCSDG